jgi:hypothetical protein
MPYRRRADANVRAQRQAAALASVIGVVRVTGKPVTRARFASREFGT